MSDLTKDIETLHDLFSAKELTLYIGSEDRAALARVIEAARFKDDLHAKHDETCPAYLEMQKLSMEVERLTRERDEARKDLTSRTVAFDIAWEAQEKAEARVEAERLAAHAYKNDAADLTERLLAEQARVERLRGILAALVSVPAITAVLGSNHTGGCFCPLCAARAALSEEER